MSAPKELAPHLKAAFDRFYQAPLETWEEFASHCSVVHFKKDDVIKSQFTKERYFYFIVEGCAGVFLWKENNFVCLDFAFEHDFCSDYMSILTNSETPLQVVALEPTVTLRMTVENYNQITQEATGKILRMVAAEMSFIGKQKQQIDLLTLSASERYKLLLLQFPNIQNRVAQNHIASYLGITPQSLSRIRRMNALGKSVKFEI